MCCHHHWIVERLLPVKFLIHQLTHHEHSYQNSSLFVATLQPCFTILCNITISRGLLQVFSLVRHASSLRQKRDMLAVHMREGDLPVWCVARVYNADNPATVV
ncbi:Uncharacterized protein HZ326_26944 [Fusarium oxysporum f. sp. albedinis]|nr:Uncharacterized protein HZ326_26944 [Fusarium oxysporum f. sp. albedinis]